MTRNEFIQRAAISFAAVGQVDKAAWEAALALADAAPAGTFDAVRSVPASSGGASGGAVFPPFGQSKGQPVSGASERTLRFYAGAAVRSLSDSSKERFHDKERQSLAAYVAEMERQGFDASEFKAAPAQPSKRPAFMDEPATAASNDDIPF